MANFTAKTTITTSGGEKIVASAGGNYSEVFRATMNAQFGTATTGTMQEIVQTHTITDPGYSGDLKYLLIKNVGQAAIELAFTVETWADGAPDANGAEDYIRMLIPVGDYMLLPNIRMVTYDSGTTGAGAGVLTSAGVTPDSNLYLAVNNIDNNDAQLLDGAISSTTTETITVDDTTYFYPGDLIQIGTEIVEVLYITSATVLKVKRGAYGSTAATHSDDAALRYPFFNAYHQYGDTSINGGGDGSSVKVKTDVSGRFKCFNMFGSNRHTTFDADGVTPGSFNLQFRTDGGYQEFGLSGITASTTTALAVSTEYKFNITVDSGSLHDNLAFTTDSSNVNWGGTNGVISKIQAAFDEQYYTSGNLFERGITIGIVNGDIRVSSTSNRSGSAILLAGPTAGTTPFGVGRVPAIGSINTAVPASFPARFKSDPFKSPITGTVAGSGFGSTYFQKPPKDTSGMAWDDGKGNIMGSATGTISYSTGAVDFIGPPNADFIFWCSEGSALSGGMKSHNEACNSIKEFRFRSMNWNVDASLEIIGMN